MSIEVGNSFTHLTGNTLGYKLPDMKNSTLSERLILAMTEKNISQGALAKAVGVAQPTIFRLVKGTAKGSSKLVDIAKALSVRADWLANGEGPMWDDDSQEFSGAREPFVAYDTGIVAVSVWVDGTKTQDSIWVPKSVSSKNTRAYSLERNSGCAEAPAGTVIVVDTKERPGTGDLVYAKVNQVHSVYRFLDGGNSGFLAVDDTRIPIIDVETSAEIIGVVVFILRDLKRKK